MRINIEDLFTQAKGFLDGDPVTSQAVADEIGALLAEIRQAEKAADEARKLENKPFDDGKAEVQERYGLSPISLKEPKTCRQCGKERCVEAERKLAEAERLNDRAADLMRQCTDPERFVGASTLNVYANMRAWLSDLSKEAERG